MKVNSLFIHTLSTDSYNINRHRWAFAAPPAQAKARKRQTGRLGEHHGYEVETFERAEEGTFDVVLVEKIQTLDI